MKNRILLCAATMVACASCTTPGAMDPRAFDPSLGLVLDRYAAYVATGVKPDGSPLVGVEAETWAATGEEVRTTWSVALAEAE